MGEVVVPPAGSEDPGVAQSLEVLVGDVADQPAEESHHRQGLEQGLAAFGVVPEGEADRAALGIVVGDAVLGEHRPLGVAADVTQGEAGIAQAASDVGVL
jgi:hypothetical protein